MKKYTYLVNFDSQTLERVGESFAVKGDGGIAELVFVIPSNFGVPANQALWRVFFRLPGEKDSLFETLPTVTQAESGDYVTSWTISKAITQKAGRLAFSLAAISGENVQWNSRTVIMQVPESQYQPEREEAEEPYTGRLTILEGDMAQIRGEFAEVQEDFEELKETATLGTPIPESLVANMQAGHVYIYTGTEPGYTAGHVYYYVNGTLTDNGVYGGANIDDTLTVSGQAADAKVTGDKIAEIKEDLNAITETVYGKNRFNINGNITEGYYLSSDGSLVTDARWNISDYCYVEGFTNVYCWSNLNNNTFTMWYACAYDSHKDFLSYLGYGYTFALPEGTVYIRFCEQSFNDQIMLESGTTKTIFEAYSKKYTTITDNTLTLANVPADAKAVGENIGKVKDQLSYSAVNFTLIDSKFLNGDTGEITDSSGTNNKVSNYIEIVPNSKIMITTEHFWSQGLYAFYDEDNNFISGKKSNSGGTVTQIYNEIVKTPINAKYLVVGFLYQASMTEPFVFQGITQYANPSSIWADKKWAVIGDSLTAYNDKTSMHYFDYIAGATGINIHNMGVSGSGYAKLDNNFRTRALTVPTDSDVVTFFGSGNDSDAGLELGTASDTGTATLGGCINTAIDNLYSIMPLAQLGIVTPTPWQGNMPLNNGWMERYSNLIVEICKRRSIPCLDLFHCSGLNPNDANVRTLAYSKDNGGGVHPDENGHKLIAPKFKAFLETLLLS